ncbi:zinc transporter ZIP4 [Struthio camelus]|uniref:zinc transporter ZIP4 n=1 Tax=Struthio camelus TaxID=8801 RepID=UPI0036041148
MAPLLALLALSLAAAADATAAHATAAHATAAHATAAAGPPAALGALLSSGEGALPRAAVEALVGAAAARAHCPAGPCGKCISAEDVFGLVGKGGRRDDARLEAAELPWLGTAVLLAVSEPAGACAATAAGSWAARARALHASFAGAAAPGGPSLEAVAGLMGAVQRNYRGAAAAQHEPCVDAARVLAESAAAAPRVGAGLAERVLATLGAHVVRGSCLRALPPPTFFLDYIFERFGNGSQNLSLEGLSALMEELELIPVEQHEGDHEHVHEDAHAHEDARASGRSSAWDTVCLGPSALLQVHGLDAAAPLTRSDFARLGPALLQQRLSGACPGAHATAGTAAGELSTAERYVYGSLATLAVCLCSLCGITLLLCTACAGARPYVVQLFVSLAVGSLTGDALLHLVPQFLGLHAHSHAAGGHQHGDGDGDARYTWKLLAVLGGLYGFFLLEKLFSILVPQEAEAAARGGSRCQHAVALQRCQDGGHQHPQGSSRTELVQAEDPPESQTKPEPLSRELRTLPYALTAGDAIHNLADGLALGAAFAASWRTGLATSLAVLCHELPHELGDFAALLHAGLSVRRALLLNFASALTAFLGLYVGLAVATSAELEAWIFTVATGLFLYVALCDMLPAMLSVQDRRPWLLFALHNAGLLAGWAALLLLSLYEDSIVL